MSIDNEKNVISGICNDEDAFDAAAGILTADDFTGRHRVIFGAIESIVSEKVIPELGTLVAQLQKTDSLNSVGGAGYLAEVLSFSPSTANIKFYAKKVRDESIRRQVNQFADKILNFQGPSDLLVALVENGAFDFGISESKDPVHISSSIRKVAKNMEKARDNRGSIMGLTTGITGLDSMLNGLQPGKVYLVAGRPAMGKSAFGLDIVRRNKDVASLFISMEMENEELAQRAVCSEAKVDSFIVNNGRCDVSHWGQLTSAFGALAGSKIWTQDRPSQTMGQVYSTARKWKRKHGLGLLVVDYLQLVDGKGSEYETIGEASRMFKRIAKELKIPVVVLSQLNRELEKRDDKRPKLSDLRGSGQIEQDADCIIFPYREAIYCDCRGMADTCGKDHWRDAEIIVAKHRGGKVGMIPAKYIGEHTTFIDC